MKTILSVFLIGVLLISSACNESTLVTTEEANKPNIILILTDDQRADTLPYMPNIFESAGMNFSNAYVTTSLCCPSRTSILTGQYAHNHGVKDNKAPNGGFSMFRDEKDDHTVATALQDAGYTTALVGKYLNDYGEEGEAYVPEGWDAFYAMGGKPGYYDYNLLNYSNGMNEGFTHYGSQPEDYSTDVLTGFAKDFIEETDQPFFLYFAPFAPHTPSTAEPEHEGDFDGDAKVPLFGEMVDSLQSVDDAFAEFRSVLEAKGELDNTYIFFMSDNGYHLGENGLEGGKNTPYEIASKVPLKVFGPAISASESGDLVLNIDLCPTFLDLAGVEPRLPNDGRSYADLLRGDTLEDWREDFLLEGWGKHSFTALHEKDWVYIDFTKGDDALFDLSQDPGETSNLIEETVYQERVNAMAARLGELLDCKEAACQ